MRCIEIAVPITDYSEELEINYNMRCIEIIEQNVMFWKEFDKLQHEMY